MKTLYQSVFLFAFSIYRILPWNSRDLQLKGSHLVFFFLTGRERDRLAQPIIYFLYKLEKKAYNSNSFTVVPGMLTPLTKSRGNILYPDLFIVTHYNSLTTQTMCAHTHRKISKYLSLCFWHVTKKFVKFSEIIVNLHWRKITIKYQKCKLKDTTTRQHNALNRHQKGWVPCYFALMAQFLHQFTAALLTVIPNRVYLHADPVDCNLPRC